jgi:hypothetical protein
MIKVKNLLADENNGKNLENPDRVGALWLKNPLMLQNNQSSSMTSLSYLSLACVTYDTLEIKPSMIFSRIGDMEYRGTAQLFS